MWAVSWPGSGGSKGQSSKQRQSLTGFEHALAVDLAELVGTDAQSGTDGGAKHIAILGNTLAVATDYVVFVLRLSFDVKGEILPALRGTRVAYSDLQTLDYGTTKKRELF